jgi:pimeloyl-ACP methyl ester carboxylesterase
MWFSIERGAGPPLVLLHGIGMSHAAWNAVLPRLSERRRIVAFDIAGFGRTPPLPARTPPTVANLVDALAGALRLSGIEVPVDIAGSSLGAVMALEAAKRGIARRVVAISPPCLWESRPPRHVEPVFAALRLGARYAPTVLKGAMGVAWIREALLAVPISIGSRRMPAEDARRAVEDLRNAAAFEDTFIATGAPFEGRGITTPLTIAFGGRDWILSRDARCRDRLPAHTRWTEHREWGHVPMWCDPEGVADLILEGTR